jgi:hypothetical protein
MADNSNRKEDYMVVAITKGTEVVTYKGEEIKTSVDVVHLAKLPAKWEDRKIVLETLKQIAELERDEGVQRYNQLSKIPEFQLSSEQKKERSELEKSDSVRKFLEVKLDAMGYREYATMSSFQGEYKLGDTLHWNLAERNSSFKRTEHLELLGGHGSRSNR